jgi:hypothetical protein
VQIRVEAFWLQTVWNDRLHGSNNCSGVRLAGYQGRVSVSE